MGHRQQTEVKSHALPAAKDKRKAPSTSTMPARAADGVLQQVLRHAAAANYQKAIDLLQSSERALPLRNALGVCLMRKGRAKEAIHVYREFVLSAGSTWTRDDLPIIYKTNYATALLLGGLPSGCAALLGDLPDQSHPAVVRLRSAIHRWECTLSFWNWLNWRYGRIDPENCPVVLDFPPGDFEEPAPGDVPSPVTPKSQRPQAA